MRLRCRVKNEGPETGTKGVSVLRGGVGVVEVEYLFKMNRKSKGQPTFTVYNERVPLQ